MKLKLLDLHCNFTFHIPLIKKDLNLFAHTYVRVDTTMFGWNSRGWIARILRVADPEKCHLDGSYRIQYRASVGYTQGNEFYKSSNQKENI